jgi:hypothetical protein
VTIPGWLDEDGEAVSSVVLVAGEPQQKRATKEERKLEDMKTMLRGAWFRAGTSLFNNTYPIIEPREIKSYLIEVEGCSESEATNQCARTRPTSLISKLAEARFIEKIGRGWIVREEAYIASWISLAKTLQNL